MCNQTESDNIKLHHINVITDVVKRLNSVWNGL